VPVQRPWQLVFALRFGSIIVFVAATLSLRPQSGLHEPAVVVGREALEVVHGVPDDLGHLLAYQTILGTSTASCLEPELVEHARASSVVARTGKRTHTRETLYAVMYAAG
jgi:hypothetical protein